MLKLQLTPDQANYQFAASNDVIRTKVAGGAARYRLDQLNSDQGVDIQFTLNPTEYQYLRAFYKYCGLGADPFLMDLILETPDLQEYVAHFRPNTWKLTAVKGNSYTVKMTLDVAPNSHGINYAELVNNFTPEPFVSAPPPTDWGNEV